MLTRVAHQNAFAEILIVDFPLEFTLEFGQRRRNSVEQLESDADDDEYEKLKTHTTNCFFCRRKLPATLRASRPCHLRRKRTASRRRSNCAQCRRI